MIRKGRIIPLILLCCHLHLVAQQNAGTEAGQIHGNLEVTAQYYNSDTVIGAPEVPEHTLLNTFTNLIYTKGKFEAGMRYEAYLNVVQGFDPGYEGTGIPYRYASYKGDDLQFTVGSFYEQFGSGMIFRSYEERALGIDNAMDGIRVRYKPFNGLYLKGIWGYQRLFFDHGPGIVRGFDGELILNEMIKAWNDKNTRYIFGGSFVSKFQEDKDPTYVLPENVGCYGGRVNVVNSHINLYAEYAYKINDPSFDNFFIYKPGQALYASAGYSRKGFGFTLSAKSIDNMSYRSDRNQLVNNLNINYLPALTKQHTYNLAATLYPYGTQTTGEVGYQADMIFKVKKHTKLGGKYGTTVMINFSSVNAPDTTRIYDYIASNAVNPKDSARMGYTGNLFGMGHEKYYQDFNIELSRKLNKKFKLKMMYMNLIFNNNIVKVANEKGTYYADIAVLEGIWKIKPKHSVDIQLQHLRTNQDQKNWATGVVEYTISPHWSFSMLDQYNYGNDEAAKRIHYLMGMMIYIKGANRISLSYGRQRAGVFCVGGICRNVPASNGLTLSITSSF